MSSAIFGGLLKRRISSLAKDRRGVSAVEFALLAPLMIGLYLSGVEVSEGIGIDRKVTLTAGAMANLAAQTSTISNADMTNIMNAAKAIMSPYPTTTLTITVTCIDIDSTGKAIVKWSDSFQGTARAVGSVMTLPSALAVPGTSLIFAETAYIYKPIIGHTITGTLTLTDKMYMSPRQSATVTRTS
jgi:Flp pilus assembly protein TadG